MTAKKILIVPNAEITISGGRHLVEKSTGEFASELQKLGNNVTFFGQFLTEKNNIHVFDLHKNSISVLGQNRKSIKVVNYILLYLAIIPAIFRSDFIYIFYPGSFKFVGILCKIFGKKYGLYVRGSDEMSGVIASLLYRNSTVVFSVAEYFTKNINDITGVERAFTIRPMIDLTKQDIIYEKEFVEKTHYSILYLGRLTNDKGIIELLGAVEKLKHFNFNFHLTIVGDGEYAIELQKLAEKLKILEYVTFTGAVFGSQDVKRYFENANIFILPSYHEGFPRTLYEAMIFGTPIITTFVGGISSVMVHKSNCVEIKPKSVSSIVEAFTWSFQNYHRFGPIVKNATHTVETILTQRKYSHAEDLNRFLNPITN